MSLILGVPCQHWSLGLALVLSVWLPTARLLQHGSCNFEELMVCINDPTPRAQLGVLPLLRNDKRTGVHDWDLDEDVKSIHMMNHVPQIVRRYHPSKISTYRIDLASILSDHSPGCCRHVSEFESRTDDFHREKQRNYQQRCRLF